MLGSLLESALTPQGTNHLQQQQGLQTSFGSLTPPSQVRVCLDQYKDRLRLEAEDIFEHKCDQRKMTPFVRNYLRAEAIPKIEEALRVEDRRLAERARAEKELSDFLTG